MITLANDAISFLKDLGVDDSVAHFISSSFQELGCFKNSINCSKRQGLVYINTEIRSPYVFSVCLEK